MIVRKDTFGQVFRAASMWRLWVHSAVTDTSMHYRRSFFGPFWLTMNMLVLVAALGMLYSTLFRMDVRIYLPYVTGGIMGWYLISALINDGALVFISNAPTIKNTNIPLPYFAFKAVFRNLVIFFHHTIVIIPIYMFFPEYLTINLIYLIPGVLIIAIFGFWMMLLMGMLCSRYRDLPNLVTQITQILFFVTPIFWPADNMKPRIVVDANVFYHYLELLRAPILGNSPTLLNWVVTLGVTSLGLAVTLLFYSRFHSRIVHTL